MVYLNINKRGFIEQKTISVEHSIEKYCKINKFKKKKKFIKLNNITLRNESFKGSNFADKRVCSLVMFD